MIPLTCNEIRRLLVSASAPNLYWRHRLRWSIWRRRHDPRSASFIPRYTATLVPSALTMLEHTALDCLAELGLAKPTSSDVASLVVT